ncbi:MAG: hypothetical protein IJQ16_05725 [Selenomonadaceae bacterium]|nr:hypothetical protein [Selenomonadaceae bacterium]
MDKIFKAVKQDGAIFFVLATLNLPIILQAFVDNKDFLPSVEKFFHYAQQFFGVATIIFAVTIAINFLLAKRKKLKKFLQRAFIIIFAVMFAAEFFYLSKFKRALDTDILEIFLENLFAPEVLIGIIFFVTLLVIGIQDLQKIFKSMSTKKIKRLTYALIIIFVFTIISMIYLL